MYPDDQRATKMVTFSSMPPEMEEAAAEMAVKAVMNLNNEEDIAENIKQVAYVSTKNIKIFIWSFFKNYLVGTVL